MNWIVYYLDRLCIVQDDDMLKKSQVEAMGAIYQLTDLTIVACAEGVGVGLPGVSSRPRQTPLENYTWDFTSRGDGDYPSCHRASPISPDSAVNTSSWNTRGWTYQERVLSRRPAIP